MLLSIDQRLKIVPRMIDFALGWAPLAIFAIDFFVAPTESIKLCQDMLDFVIQAMQTYNLVM